MNYVDAGKRIKLLREGKNMTQADLAEAVHLEQSFIERIENGGCRALDDLDIAVELTIVLDTSLEYIGRGIEGRPSVRKVYLKRINAQ